MTKRLLVALLLVVALGGCKSKCRQLSEKLCDCSVNTTDKDNCLRRASSQEANRPLTAEEEKTCSPLVDTCDCRLIDTPEGKVNCGLARPLK